MQGQERSRFPADATSRAGWCGAEEVVDEARGETVSHAVRRATESGGWLRNLRGGTEDISSVNGSECDVEQQDVRIRLRLGLRGRRLRIRLGARRRRRGRAEFPRGVGAEEHGCLGVEVLCMTMEGRKKSRGQPRTA